MSVPPTDAEPIGHRFEPLLLTSHATSPPGEVRNRLTTVLKAMRDAPPPDALMSELRVVELLAALNSPDARKMLAALAAGAAGSRLTEAAKAALQPPSQGPVKK